MLIEKDNQKVFNFVFFYFTSAMNSETQLW